jgi:acyl-CoA synthetase (AMP-forming)/AMP-acid ligase II
VAVSEILMHCRTHLEAAMVPKYVEIVSSLPKSAHGKVDKQSLQKASEGEWDSPLGDGSV